MLSRRLIACLDVRDGCVVKGVQFEDLLNAGDPAALARRYNAEGIDELVILDVTATVENRRALAATLKSVAAELFIPLTVGGGIRSDADADAAIDAGADKVAVNSAALDDPALLTRLAGRYGSQAVVVAIDAKRDGDRFAVFARSGRAATDRTAVEWAVEAADRGAGEVLLTSIDRDGTRAGFDCELTAAVSSAVAIPVIASGRCTRRLGVSFLGARGVRVEVVPRRARRPGASVTTAPTSHGSTLRSRRSQSSQNII
jgi:cyclase